MADLSFLGFLVLLLPLTLLLLLYLIVRPKPVRIPIKDRHVFITGGSSGIGLALAHQAAKEGARVSILARSGKKLEEAKQSIQLATGIEVATYSADVRDFDAVKTALDEAGPVDVLVVNQGVFVPGELEVQSLDEVRLMIDVNITGSFHMIKAALPLIKKRQNGGPASIALMSSQAGQCWTIKNTNMKGINENKLCESSGKGHGGYHVTSWRELSGQFCLLGTLLWI
ncbi:hypothetical protein CISIN_1g0177571mg, partial [Citrus sinensis]